MEQAGRVGVGGEVASAFMDGEQGVLVPPAESVQGGEEEIGGRTTLAANQFATASHVVLHPGGLAEVIGITANLTHVKGTGGHQVGDIGGGAFHHEIRAGHLTPELGFHHETIKVSR